MSIEQINRRGRRRRLPEASPGFSHPGPRYYCPACGEVRGGQGSRGSVSDRRVQDHWRWTITDARSAADTLTRSEALRQIRCDGGAIDPVKDRAP